MRILLDTHVLLWSVLEPERLDAATRAALLDERGEVFFSAASIWEIAIKKGRGRPDFLVDPERIANEARDIGFTELPVSADSAARVAALPPYHGDPFDRLLVVQALSLPAHLYTADRKLPRYSELVKLVG